VARLAAVLPGYASVARASEVLHLAPRSVRDLIYSGRLPSLRIGRLHYVRASDLELERRRRLGLRLPARRARTQRVPTERKPRPERPPVDPELRRARAAARAADVSRWAERHGGASPHVPFHVVATPDAATCAVCARRVKLGARVLLAEGDNAALCLTCGRRAVMDWADRRRLESAAARRLAHNLGDAAEPESRSPEVESSPRVA
jgi:hypothetical protein